MSYSTSLRSASCYQPHLHLVDFLFLASLWKDPETGKSGEDRLDFSCGCLCSLEGSKIAGYNLTNKLSNICKL